MTFGEEPKAGALLPSWSNLVRYFVLFVTSFLPSNLNFVYVWGVNVYGILVFLFLDSFSQCKSMPRRCVVKGCASRERPGVTLVSLNSHISVSDQLASAIGLDIDKNKNSECFLIVDALH